MSGLRSVLASVCVCLALVCASAAPARALEVKENPLFMEQFAQFVKGTLDREPETRAKLRELVMANKAKVREGFGMHPELVPALMEAAGLEQLICAIGRNYGELEERLNREEAAAFYDTAQQLDYWVLMMAEEEAVTLGVLKASPPLNYRPDYMIPWAMAIKMRKVVEPYAGTRPSPRDMKGLGFDKLLCN